MRKYRVTSYIYGTLDVMANSFDDACEQYYLMLCSDCDIKHEERPDRRDVINHIDSIVNYGFQLNNEL